MEFDKYAIKSYNAVHGTDFPPIDIKNMTGKDLEIKDKDKFTYLLTYSFPCTDISLAGKQLGMSRDSNTRSGLLWEVERLLNETEELPDILLMENVPQVHGKKNIDDFNQWIKFLEQKGYSNYYQDLNAKDFGVAQNRNRCFMISILGDYGYEFPKKTGLNKTIEDYLEDEAEEKFYLNNEKADALVRKLKEERRITRDISLSKVIMASRGRYNPDGKTTQHPEIRGGFANTLTGVQKDNLVLEGYFFGENNNR